MAGDHFDNIFGKNIGWESHQRQGLDILVWQLRLGCGVIFWGAGNTALQ